MKRSILISSAILALTSCNGFLDLTPTDSISDKVMWAKVESAEYAVNSIYSYCYDIYAEWPCLAGATEALTDQLKYGSYLFNAYHFIPSQIAYGGSNLTENYVSVYLGVWPQLYAAVRRTNEAIHNLKTLGGELPDADRDRLEGELLFMRGWLYFELVKRYKEVIIYDEDLSAIVVDKNVSTEKEGWDFIQADLNGAAEKLPAKAQAKGRLDKGAAYALLSRTMLYAGRWDAVVAAADEVQKLGYSLSGNYADAFTVSSDAGNPETILQYSFSYADNVTHQYDYFYAPGGDYKLVGQQGGGFGTPTQEMVESYELATGGLPDWSAWHTSTTTNPPYALLEPRFRATILYNGAPWKGRAIEPFVGGTDGWCTWNKEPQPQGRTTTGYYLRKGVDEGHDLGVRGESTQHFVLLRYGEVLLNKAEACWHNTDYTGANAAVREIRARVGLPYADLSGDALFAAIRQERRVELAYEGLWYWDLRRWEAAAKAWPEGLNGYQVHGLKIEATGTPGQFKYTYVSVDDQDRDFPAKMYRFPIPQSELSSNGIIQQYPEWR